MHSEGGERSEAAGKSGGEGERRKAGGKRWRVEEWEYIEAHVVYLGPRLGGVILRRES